MFLTLTAIYKYFCFSVVVFLWCELSVALWQKYLWDLWFPSRNKQKKSKTRYMLVIENSSGIVALLYFSLLNFLWVTSCQLHSCLRWWLLFGDYSNFWRNKSAYFYMIFTTGKCTSWKLSWKAGSRILYS